MSVGSATRILIHRPAGLGIERIETGLWWWSLQHEIYRMGKMEVAVDPYLSPWMGKGRNMAMHRMLDEKFDYLLMVDPDMIPDIYVGSYSKADRFFSTAIAALRNRPCGIVAAPYVGPGPKFPVYAWYAGDDGEMVQCTHEQCVERVLEPRMEQVVGAGTGVMLVDRLAAEKMEPPYFKDTWANKERTKMRLSFDVYFCARAYDQRVPVWCNWYSYAGHVHPQLMTCPGLEVETNSNFGWEERKGEQLDDVADGGEREPEAGTAGEGPEPASHGDGVKGQRQD